MRSFKHLTARYAYDRLRDRRFIRRNPDLPWITPEAIAILDAALAEDAVGLESGTGRSTLWFAQRLGHLIAIEHDPSWFESVRHQLESTSTSNVDLQLRGIDIDDRGTAPYVESVAATEDSSLDFVLVDGVLRDQVALAAVPKVAPGGILAIDDAHRYLPSRSRSPLSRSIEDGPDGDTWFEFVNAVSSWKALWTSSGVSDTVLFTRPP